MMHRDDPSKVSPAEQLRRLLYGHRVTQMLYAAAELQIADGLREIPKTAADLASAVEADPRSLARLLRGLASLGVVSESDEGLYSLTEVGQCLTSGATSGMHDYALFEGAKYFQEAWADLNHSIRTGQVACEHVYGKDFYGYIRTDPGALATFSRAMGNAASLAARAVVATYDFSNSDRVVDVGGGYGRLLLEILGAHGGPSGVLFDLPELEERAVKAIQSAGMSDRCTFEGGTYLECVPQAGDTYILSRILMAHDDAVCIKVLNNCRSAMRPDGKLLVVQQIMPEIGESGDSLFEAAMSDLNMLVMLGGQDRTLSGYRRIIESSGLEVMRVLHAKVRPSPTSVRSTHSRACCSA